MRLTSALWISALLRRVSAKGGFAAVLRKGSDQAGAIFVVERKGETVSLWGPAPQAFFLENLDEGQQDDRLFECLLKDKTGQELQEKLDRQIAFDPDCYIIEIEGCTADLPTGDKSRKTQDGNDQDGNDNAAHLDELNKLFK